MSYYSDSIDAMSYVEDENSIQDWDVGVIQCGICHHRSIVILPRIAKRSVVECNKCGVVAAVFIDKDTL